MFAAEERGQFAEELAELHDGSISLYVTLPVFRAMMLSQRSAAVLVRFESVIAEHLAQLDDILGDVLIRRDRLDGQLTRSLFRSVAKVRAWPATAARDEEILNIIELAQLFLMGSCSFALRSARLARIEHSAQVLEQSLARIGALAVALVTTQRDAVARQEWSDAVA